MPCYYYLFIFSLFPLWALAQPANTDSDIEVENMVEINSEDLDFSPSLYANGIVFVSSRRKNGPIDKGIGETFFELYYAELDPNGDPMSPQAFSININSTHHEGPVCFSPEGDRLYFTRNNAVQGAAKSNSKGRTGMKVYEAERGYFDWENVRELSFNSDEYNCMHPSLSSDGRLLYFASDRPGGKGGMDIWVTAKTPQGWSEPVNMGDRINSADNEVFPFIHESGTLFFSSDGHKGFGGLDLFMIDMSSNEWGETTNLGAPFNTPEDDLGLILLPDGEIGYFSSNRKGGLGKDDLYRFRAPTGIKGTVFPNMTQTVILAYDEQSGRKLNGVSLRIYEAGDDELQAREGGLYDLELLPAESGGEKMVFRRVRKKEDDLGDAPYVTNGMGEAYASLNAAGTYTLLLSKPGYISQEITYQPAENVYGRPVEVGLVPSNCVTLSGLVASTPYNKPIPSALVRIVNQCNGQEELIRTNINGTFEHCIAMGCDFTIVTERPGYRRDSTTISTIKLRGRRSFAVVMEMPPESSSVLSAPITEGAVILLQNILYDFGKSTIRSGEAEDLESLVKLMQTYPSMEIELISHTDCRGEEQFNLELSLKRAEAAKDFLVNKGISAARIKAFGYGEALPVNDCRCAQTDCTEQEHEANRRTEVRIARINEPIGARE